MNTSLRELKTNKREFERIRSTLEQPTDEEQNHSAGQPLESLQEQRSHEYLDYFDYFLLTYCASQGSSRNNPGSPKRVNNCSMFTLEFHQLLIMIR